MRSTTPSTNSIDNTVTHTARAVDPGVATDRERMCTGTAPVVVPCPEGIDPEAWRVAAVFLVGVGCGGGTLEDQLASLVEVLEDTPVAERAQELDEALLVYARWHVLSTDDFEAVC